MENNDKLNRLRTIKKNIADIIKNKQYEDDVELERVIKEKVRGDIDALISWIWEDRRTAKRARDRIGQSE